jgi:hypothetical protein
MFTIKKFHYLFFSICLLTLSSWTISAQDKPQNTPVVPSEQSSPDGIALAPTRFELELSPGAETTVVVNLNYHSSDKNAPPSRIVASLNDWTISKEGQVVFHKANTLKNSASSWIVYSPASMTVMPGSVHSIRVTISVPKDATPGDHLSALIVEPRPDNLKLDKNQRQVIVRYRMAAVIYVKVPKLTRLATLQNLKATSNAEGAVITSTVKNEGNSVVRPIASAKVIDANGRIVAEITDTETLPVLAESEVELSSLIPKALGPGKYTIRYKIDFQGGGKITEGITELVVQDKTEDKAKEASSLNQ